MTMNLHAMRAIYRFEMARTRRTLMQSVISPVISTSLYFVVFGAAIGSRIPEVGGISYGGVPRRCLEHSLLRLLKCARRWGCELSMCVRPATSARRWSGRWRPRRVAAAAV